MIRKGPDVLRPMIWTYHLLGDDLRRRHHTKEVTNFLNLLPVSVCARPGSKMATAISHNFHPQEQTNKKLPEKSSGSVKSSRTHQKTDKTGPETHQRTVVPGRSKKNKGSAPAAWKPTSNRWGHSTAAEGWDAPGLVHPVKVIHDEGMTVKWRLCTQIKTFKHHQA